MPFAHAADCFGTCCTVVALDVAGGVDREHHLFKHTKGQGGTCVAHEVYTPRLQ